MDAAFNPDTSPIGQYEDFAQQIDGNSIVVGAYIFNNARYKYISRLNLDGSIDHSFQSTTSPEAMFFISSVVVKANRKIVIRGG